MKNCTALILGFILLIPEFASGQMGILTDAWKDPQFAKQFTGSFLPLTEQEPNINEDEAALFQELSTMLGNNQVDEAIARLNQALQTEDPEKPSSAALNYTLGNIYIQGSQFLDAIRQYEIAIKKFPNFRRAYKNLGLAQIQAGQFEAAIENIVKAVELGDSSGDTFGLLAYSYLNTGNTPAALEGYRQASLLNPGNREWQIGKAEALMRAERYSEAIAEFKHLIDAMPDRSAFYTSISNAYLGLGDATTAALYLEILFRSGDASASALGLLGDIYINEGLPSLAYKAYSAAIEKPAFPNQRSIRTLRAFLQRGNYEEAENFLDLIQQLRQQDLSVDEAKEVLNLQAQLALARGQDQEAAEILERVLESDPMNGNALMLLGQYYHDNGDLENAIFYYDRAVRISEFQRDAQLQLARIYVQQKEYASAIEQLEEALALEYSSNVQDFLDAVRSVYNRSF